MLPPSTDSSFDLLLARAGAVALGAGLVWAAAVLVAVTVEAATRGRVRAALALGCPPHAHRRLLAAASVVVGAVLAAPGTAQAADALPDVRALPAALDGLPLPDRAAGGPVDDRSAARALASRDPAASEVSGLVTVRAGQTLWEISRSRLPARAAPDRIAALTRSLHQANRQVIGPDPDLIHPGQQLTVPPRPTTDDREDS